MQTQNAKEQANKGNEVPQNLTHAIITGCKVIKANSKNCGILNKIYADREFYHSTDSLYTIHKTLDESLQTSPVGKRLHAYIK